MLEAYRGVQAMPSDVALLEVGEYAQLSNGQRGTLRST